MVLSAFTFEGSLAEWLPFRQKDRWINGESDRDRERDGDRDREREKNSDRDGDKYGDKERDREREIERREKEGYNAWKGLTENGIREDR